MQLDTGIITSDESQPTGLQEFWTWVRRMFTDPYRDEITAYLSESIDHADLERRIQVLMRRGMI